MKKIGLITFHNARSFGAGFQVYALQSYLQQNGYDTEVIDYLPPRFLWSNILHIPNASNPVKRCIKFCPYVICQTTSYCVMRRFCHTYLKLSEKRFLSAKELENFSFSYDVFMTGSDQVWNLNFDSFENVRPYLLHFVPMGAQRIAYAASIGMDSLEQVPDAIRAEYLSLLRKYDSIAVRECSAAKLLQQEKIQASWVLDPTFLIPADQWCTMARKPRGFHNRPFVFVYGLYRNKNLYHLAQGIAQAHHWQIVNMADGYDFCRNARNDIVVRHEELLWYLSNAQCVITDSFHGTALSINFNTPLFVFRAARYNTRLESLIQLFSLENRVADHMETSDTAEVSMNYKEINARLEKEREHAGLYLKRALQKKETK